MAVESDPSGWRWPAPIAFAGAVGGLAVSTYLTVEHYTTPAILACPADQVVDCRRVTASAQSVVLGVPVAVLGVAYFAVMLGLTMPAAWRRHHGGVRVARLALTVVGALFVLYLIYAELFVIDAICLWCTVVHAATVVMATGVAFAVAEDPPPAPARSSKGGPTGRRSRRAGHL